MIWDIFILQLRDHSFKTLAFFGGGVKNWPNLPTDTSTKKTADGRGVGVKTFADVLNGWSLITQENCEQYYYYFLPASIFIKDGDLCLSVLLKSSYHFSTKIKRKISDKTIANLFGQKNLKHANVIYKLT